MNNVITQSIRVMLYFYGKGVLGIQIFYASTDLVGKPIVICQIFKPREGTGIEGNSEGLNQQIPCKLEDFQQWLSRKRAIGIGILRDK